MKILLWLGLSTLAGWLYRRGGTNKGTLWRDIGATLVNLAYCFILGLFVGFRASLWAYLLAFGLLWGAYSAYWGLDEKKFGYWAHGLGLSLALLPIVYLTGNWLGFIIRCVVLTLSITLWSEYTTNDVAEEMGRGFIANAAIPLLLI